MQRHPASPRLPLLLTVLIPACAPDPIVVFGPSGDGHPTNLPDPIGAADFATGGSALRPRMQWSPDGRTLYYLPQVGPAPGVSALDLDTKETRVLATGVGSQVLRITEDGAYLFHSAYQHGAYTIVRLAIGGGAREPLVELAEASFGISPDGRMLAFRTESGVFVRNVETGETRSIPGAGDPIAISPDHGQLVHSTAGRIRTTSLTNGAVAELVPAGLQGQDVRWGDQGAEVVSTGRNIIQLARGGGAPVTVWSMQSDGIVINAVSLSPDGGHVIASIGGICGGPCNSWLELINVATGANTPVAWARQDLGAAHFTRDGRSIAFASQGRAYVLEVR